MRAFIVASVVAAAFAVLVPEQASAQTAQGVWAPSGGTGSGGTVGTGVYTGEPGVPAEPRTRANPVHWVGFAMGAAGVVGGAVTLLTGLFIALFRGDPGPFLITGAVLFPVGGVAMLTAGILLATDRITVDEDVELSFTLQPSSDGARGTLSLSF